MSSKDDIEAGETKPLLKKVTTQDRADIDDLEEVGGVDTAANFKNNVQYAVRLALMMTLVACIVWVPALSKPCPNQIQARIPLVICLLVFTCNPILGTSLKGGILGTIGTFWACLHMWIMNGIFPGGMKEGMSPTSATAIFGWVNMLLFLWVFLWCKCGMGMKMFALSTDIGFMLAFLDPKSATPFSENFTISHKGTAVNTMLCCFIVTVLAPVFNLLPYPMNFAFRDMKDNAMKASKDTAKLFTHIAMYYCGSENSVVIEAELNAAADLRKEIDGLGGSIGAAWWEGFDAGARGTIRALMEAHHGLMNEVFDKMKATLIAVSQEGFEESHCRVADKIRGSTKRVMLAVKKLLIAVTDAASDGDISSSEKTQLLGLVKDTKEAVKQLGKDFDTVRRTFNKPISEDLFGESFFVVGISGYARLVWEYTEMMCSNPPQGSGVFAGVTSGFASTWDFSAMTERFHMNFTVKHFIAIVFCWFYSVYVDGFGGGCVITSVFLMSESINPDVQALLNILISVVLGVVVGSMIFNLACSTGIVVVLPICAYVIWNVSLYGFFSGGGLATPFLLIAALTPFKWVGHCPTGDVGAGARGLWAGMVATCIAIFFVSCFQFALAPGKASDLAIGSMDAAFGDLKKGFTAFWANKDAKESMGGVAGHLGSCGGYNASAKIEPRLWRVNWKGGLCDEVLAHLGQLRLDILMMYTAMGGTDGHPDAIFDKFRHAPEFREVQQDLDTTLDDAHRLVVAILSHESGHFDGLSKLKTISGIDTLEALPGLIESLGKGGLKFPAKLEDTMENDELCQISMVLMMLDGTIKSIAGVLKSSIRNC